MRNSTRPKAMIIIKMSNAPLPPSVDTGMSATEEATARTLILAILHRYASLARENNDHTETVKLFEPGGKIRFPDGRELSPDQLGEITRGNSPKMLRHNLTTVDVQFVSADEAHCQSYIIAGTDVKMPDHWGRWDDVLRRQGDGRWLFVSKTVNVGGMDPDGWLASLSKGKQ